MRRPAATAVLLGLLLAAAPAARADVHGAVGGVRDPAAGVVELTVLASEDDGVGLRSASAVLGGERLAAADFADPACLPDAHDPEAGCPGSGSVSLLIDTAEVVDGAQRLEVLVEDGAGGVTHLVDRAITIANTPIPWQSTVTLTLGSGPARPGSTVSPSGAPPVPGGKPPCSAPRLSIFLAQRPLRVRHGIPVLARGRLYRFEGRLTCRSGGRRHPRRAGHRRGAAPRRRAAGPWSSRSLKARRDGRLVRMAEPAGSRVLVFRVHAADGRIVRVRIPIRVAGDAHEARRAALAAVAAAGLAAAAPAAAQDPGTDVGGTVPSYLALGLDEPEGFATFPAGPGEYELRVRARVTARRARDAERGRRRRRLRRAGSAAWRAAPRCSTRRSRRASAPRRSSRSTRRSTRCSPCSASPVANEAATIELRQRIGAGERPRGTYAKTLLITLSTESPRRRKSLMYRSKLVLAAALAAGAAATQIAAADAPRARDGRARAACRSRPRSSRRPRARARPSSTTVTNTTGARRCACARHAAPVAAGARRRRGRREPRAHGSRGVALSATRFTLAPGRAPRGAR